MPLISVADLVAHRRRLSAADIPMLVGRSPGAPFAGGTGREHPTAGGRAEAGGPTVRVRAG
jgi:hypothetical protein